MNGEVTYTVTPTGDDELNAMQLIFVAIRPLPPRERQRVLRYVLDRETTETCEDDR